MQIEFTDRPESDKDSFRVYYGSDQKEDVFVKVTREDGKSVIVAIPDRAFNDSESAFGLNMVFGDHYE